jgi:hypothetical protein
MVISHFYAKVVTFYNIVCLIDPRTRFLIDIFWLFGLKSETEMALAQGYSIFWQILFNIKGLLYALFSIQ